MVADHPLTPDKLRGLVRKLNHFGGVAISEEGVEFDGDDVKWSDIDRDPHPQPHRVSVHRRHRQARSDKLPLPWFPFRRKVIGAISRAALTLLLAAAKQQLEGGAMEIRIPAEVRYRGMLRTANCTGHARRGGTGRPRRPRVFRGDRAGARRHGLSADDDVMEDADHRAEQIKSMLAIGFRRAYGRAQRPSAPKSL